MFLSEFTTDDRSFGPDVQRLQTADGQHRCRDLDLITYTETRQQDFDVMPATTRSGGVVGNLFAFGIILLSNLVLNVDQRFERSGANTPGKGTGSRESGLRQLAKSGRTNFCTSLLSIIQDFTIWLFPG